MLKSSKPIKLGIIGLSPGNGHPYSWSTIFNGYDREVMQECPFPVIPKYLAQQNFPEDTIEGATVTHVWAQEKMAAEHIAKATLIENVVDDYTDMIGEVDAILLARDDAERHAEFAAPFLQQGLPVYIDKVIAPTVPETKAILSMAKNPQQIFAGSALYWAQEFQLDEAARNQLGNIIHIQGTVQKDWQKYAIHIIDPMLRLIGDQGHIDQCHGFHSGEHSLVNLSWQSGVTASFSTLGKSAAPLQITVIGKDGNRTLTFTDTFAAFKASLEAFTTGVLENRVMVDASHHLRAVEIVERGGM